MTEWCQLPWCDDWSLSKTASTGFGFQARRDETDTRVWFRLGALHVSGFDADEIAIPDVLITRARKLYLTRKHLDKGRWACLADAFWELSVSPERDAAMELLRQTSVNDDKAGGFDTALALAHPKPSEGGSDG